MAYMIHTARPYMPGQAVVGLIGRACMAAYDLALDLRDAYAAERQAQKLARATRHLDSRLLRDIGLERDAS
jgi:hypothetical protein